jgi:predicted ester cyclase
MTHTGDHLGIPASKKEVAIGGMTMAKIANGKIVEAWDNWDKFALLQQLGVIPLAASANSAG